MLEMIKQSCYSGVLGIEHHSDMGAHCFGSKILSEGCLHETAVAVSRDDFAPGNSKLGVVYSFLAFADVSNAFSQVVVHVFAISQSFDLEKCHLFMLVSLSSAESNESCLDVKSGVGQKIETYLTG